MKDVNTCSSKYGYILSINNIIISEVRISSATSLPVAVVKYDVVTLKPKEGDTFRGVCVILKEDAILVRVRNVMFIRIPFMKLVHHSFDKAKNVYVSNNEKKWSSVRIGDELDVLVYAVRCDKNVNGKHEFKCIGELR